jgi:hypothetical protein
LRTTDTDGSGVGGTGFSPSVHTLDHIKVIDRSRGSSPFPCHPIPPFLPCLVSLSFDVACVLLSLLHSPSPHSISMPQTHGLDKLSPPVTLVDPRRKPARRTNGRSRVERSRSGQGGVFDYATVRPAFTFAAFPQLAFVKGTLKVVVIALVAILTLHHSQLAEEPATPSAPKSSANSSLQAIWSTSSALTKSAWKVSPSSTTTNSQPSGPRRTTATVAETSQVHWRSDQGGRNTLMCLRRRRRMRGMGRSSIKLCNSSTAEWGRGRIAAGSSLVFPCSPFSYLTDPFYAQIEHFLQILPSPSSPCTFSQLALSIRTHSSSLPAQPLSSSSLPFRTANPLVLSFAKASLHTSFPFSDIFLSLEKTGKIGNVFQATPSSPPHRSSS